MHVYQTGVSIHHAQVSRGTVLARPGVVHPLGRVGPAAADARPVGGQPRRLKPKAMKH